MDKKKNLSFEEQALQLSVEINNFLDSIRNLPAYDVCVLKFQGYNKELTEQLTVALNGSNCDSRQLNNLQEKAFQHYVIQARQGLLEAQSAIEDYLKVSGESLGRGAHK